MRLHNVRVLTANGLAAAGTTSIEADDAEDRDASGLILSPGWMDLHAHLRDPVPQPGRPLPELGP